MIFLVCPEFRHEVSPEAEPKFYGGCSFSISIWWREEHMEKSCGTVEKVQNIENRKSGKPDRPIDRASSLRRQSYR
jgi:hypothetical protein